MTIIVVGRTDRCVAIATDAVVFRGEPKGTGIIDKILDLPDEGLAVTVAGSEELLEGVYHEWNYRLWGEGAKIDFLSSAAISGLCATGTEVRRRHLVRWRDEGLPALQSSILVAVGSGLAVAWTIRASGETFELDPNSRVEIPEGRVFEVVPDRDPLVREFVVAPGQESESVRDRCETLTAGAYGSRCSSRLTSLRVFCVNEGPPRRRLPFATMDDYLESKIPESR